MLSDNGRSCDGTYVRTYVDNCLLLYILCIDINECLSDPPVCPSNLICNNMDGNYSCDCPDGTVRNGTDCVCKALVV